MSDTVPVLREFIGWWPVTVTLDDEPVTDGSDVELIALPAGERPTDPAPEYEWRPGHLNDDDEICVWLDGVDETGTWYVYVRPTPVAPEAPVYRLDGTITRF